MLLDPEGEYLSDIVAFGSLSPSERLARFGRGEAPDAVKALVRYPVGGLAALGVVKDADGTDIAAPVATVAREQELYLARLEQAVVDAFSDYAHALSESRLAVLRPMLRSMVARDETDWRLYIFRLFADQHPSANLPTVHLEDALDAVNGVSCPAFAALTRCEKCYSWVVRS